MTSLTIPRRSLLGIVLVFLMMAFLSTLSCRRETSTTTSETRTTTSETRTTTSGEVGLVWEAWNLVTSSYVEGRTLDSQEAVGDIIGAMLAESGKDSYPFLTELEDVRVRPPGDVPSELTDVWKAWTLFRQTWPDVDPKLLADAAVEGMLNSLGDESVAHLTPEAYDRARERLRGSYQGIGAFVGIVDGKIILTPMQDSPSERAGLQAGDAMLEVDGESVVGRSVQEVVEQVRGPAGTKVTLLIERPGEEEPVETNVIRGDINMVSVQPRLLPGAIGHIYISDFQENTADEMLDILEQLYRFDILALVLDLRSNPGGSIKSAQNVVSHFLSDGLFMYEIDKNGVRTDWPIEDGGMATDREKLPMVVLVNGLTGSVAEAVAGALQDTERAKIFGTTTVGKGSASEFIELSDGSAIYIPVSHWYTPSGRLIQNTGIKPDVEIPLTAEDRLIDVDAQLGEAYEYLDSLLPAFR